MQRADGFLPPSSLTMHRPPMSDLTTRSLTQKEFNLFRSLIYKEAGISLGETKQQLVESRLSKRLRALNLTTYTQYYDFLMEGDADGAERLKMINALTTNKTDFFRENHHFEYLRTHVFPMLEHRARLTGERRIRIWSAACSTGEEPYSLAMTVFDHFGSPADKGWDIRILASDVDTDVLAHASAGVYAADRVADVPREILKRHFVRTSKDPDADVLVNPRLKELIAFRRINFIEPEWPIHTSFDVIFCRNVMIYFDEKTQDTLLTRFSEKLRPESHLFIGHSESILRLDHLYKSLGNTIYRLAPGRGVSADPAPARSVTTGFVAQPSGTASRIFGRPVNKPVAAHSRSASPTTFSSAKSEASQDRWTRPATPTQEPGPESDVPVRSESIIVGEIKASASPLRITTLVGSCIAVCLFDQKARVGGMNHFMLPANSANDVVCATYGIHAMELLINEIMGLGGDRRRLVAKVFGGGNVLGARDNSDPMWAIGDRNIRFAFEFLTTDNIPVVSQDVGGNCGRQIQFLSHTGQAFVKSVQKTIHETKPPKMRARQSKVITVPETPSVVLF